MNTVVRIRVPGYDGVRDALERALDLLSPSDPLSARDEPLLLKPNLLGPYRPDRAVTTHPAVVGAAVAVALDRGAKPVVADSPGFHSLQRSAEAAGVAEICRRYGVPLLDLGRDDGRDASGSTYRSLRVAREALEAKRIWNLPKWKTHTMMGLTLGVKNLYGCVPGKRKVAAHFRSGRDPTAFARQLLDLDHILAPCLTLLDGIVAMDGAGPARGSPRPIGLLLASTHAAALDWEATRLSGFCPDDVPTVAESIRSGKLDPAAVRVLGDPAAPVRFRPAPGSPCDWPLPGPLRRALRGALSPLPRFDAGPCTACGICVETCPGRALAADRPPALSPSRCIRCYCCQELCPTGAARVPTRSVGTLVKDLLLEGRGS